MRVFVTGATGWVGSAVVSDLIAAGHRVLGLCRSDDKAAALAAAGAEVHRGSLQDLDSLRARRGAVRRRDPPRLQSRLLEIRGERRGRAARHRGDRRRAGRLRPAARSSPRASRCWRQAALRPKTIRPASLRFLPRAIRKRRSPRWRRAACAQRRCGFRRRFTVTATTASCRASSPSRARRASRAYVGDGLNRWPAVHRLDAARVFRLALEQRRGRRPVPCGRRRRRAVQGDRRSDRPPTEHAGRLAIAGTGGRTFRLVRQIRQRRLPGRQRDNPIAARLGARTARAHRRPRSPSIFRVIARRDPASSVSILPTEMETFSCVCSSPARPDSSARSSSRT